MPRRLFLFLLLTSAVSAQKFVILGDRTGEAQPGVYEAAWREAAVEKPAFVVTVGDSIQGLNDASADAEWRAWQRIVRPYRSIPLYLVPGNHDVWSDRSARLYTRYAGHPLHYSFDYRQLHFTILDNSRSDAMPAAEMSFLEEDLRAHAGQPVKFILSHRPSWLVDAVLGNTGSPLHRLAKRYGVKYVIAGHVHEMIRASMDGVEYVSLASSGGHLRLSKKYEDGWFFQYTLVEVHGPEVTFRIHELKPPYGEGRVTGLEDWGKTGYSKKTTHVKNQN